MSDSNRQPPTCKVDALAIELIGLRKEGVIGALNLLFNNSLYAAMYLRILSYLDRTRLP